MILYGPKRVLLAWAREKLMVPDFGPAAAIGIMRKGEIAAVAVFNHYQHPNIEISFARSDQNWATRDAIRAVFRFPFVQLGCKRLTATTEAKNQRTRAFLCRLGFREEGYHPDAYPSDDAVSYGMLAKDAARWLAEDRKCLTS